MSDDPQFRTVLRGFDPDQVKSALDDLQASLVTARRIAADRTIELTRMQDKYVQLERDLDEAVQRIADLESRSGQSNASVDVGARIGSILALANEEAEELRAGGRQQAKRELEEASAAIAASRSELERYAEGVRDNANSQAGQIIDDARRTADEILGQARHEAEQRRAEAEAIVESHRAQAAAVAQFGGEISHHADRLRLATARVEQLAQEEATLIERQSQDSADRIQRDMEHQLAAVEARRDSIKAQLTTVGALLHDLGSAVGVPPQGHEPVDAFSPTRRRARLTTPTGSDVVEADEQAFDRADETDDLEPVIGTRRSRGPRAGRSSRRGVPVVTRRGRRRRRGRRGGRGRGDSAGGSRRAALSRCRAQPRCGSASSMAATSSGDSGSTCGRNRWTVSPPGETRNFSKFHMMSPATPSASGTRVSDAYSGCRPGPLTSILSRIGKVTPNRSLQNDRMSSELPGSCRPNWLHGNAITVNPRSANRACSRWSPAYWGVRPHWDAVLTTRTAWSS